MIVEGEVSLYQDGKFIGSFKNHLTKNAAKHIFSYIICAYFWGQAGYYSGGWRKYHVNAYFPGSAYYITLGNGETQESSFNVTALQSNIIQLPLLSLATAGSFSSATDPFDVIFSGVITGAQLQAAFGSTKVREMGLYTYGNTEYNSYRWYISASYTTVNLGNAYFLFAYLSGNGANPDFNPDLIDITKALSVEWRIRISFG